MSTTSVAPSGIAVSSPKARVKAERWFYPISGIILLACAIVGFRLFYFEGRSYPGRDITPPIRWLVITHGMVMAAWILLVLVQPMLVAARKQKWHMMLGRVGVAVAAAVVVTGVMIGVRSAQVAPPGFMLMGFNAKEFMAVPLISVLAFGVCVGLAVWYRKKPAVHRAMMLTATLTIISAALTRIDPLNALYFGTVFDRVLGPFFTATVLAVLLLGLRCVLMRGFDRVLAAGVLVVGVLGMVIVQVARTSAWDAFASVFVS